MTYLPLMGALGLPYEDGEIIDFYSNKIKEWLITDYVPTDDEYDIMLRDLSLIEKTFSRYEGQRFKDHNLIDWTVDEVKENIDELVNQLILYENNSFSKRRQ